MPDEPKPIEGAIDVIIHDKNWDAVFDNAESFAARAIQAACAQLAEVPHGELSIAFVDNAKIQALNAHYRQKDKPTNVLSFPGDNLNPILGDIVIAYGIVKAEAEDKKISIADHTAHLLIHGYLHLSGYDHETDSDAGKMEALEITILKSLDIKNPYESYENV